MRLLRTSATHPDFIALVKQLDRYLAVTDGDEHAFYDQFNRLDTIRHVVIAYENDSPVGCGALKPFDARRTEIKRMYVAPAARRRGIAAAILSTLEEWSAEMGNTACVLETGTRQVAAVRFYEKCGYARIPNYGQYLSMANSVCFEKML